MLKKLRNKYRSLKFVISPMLLLYAVVFIVLGKTYEGFSYIIAVIIHEFAHAEEAERRGYALSCMKFTVFGASLKLQSESMSKEDERAIAIAGPAVNFCLAVFFTALWWLFPSTYFFTMDFVWANVSLLVFNCLPVYPLDGGRILITLLLDRMPREKAFRRLRISGIILAVILIVVFLLFMFSGVFNPSFLLVGIFVFASTLFPDHSCTYQRLYRVGYRTKRLKRGLCIKEIAVLPSLSIKDAYAMLDSNRYTCFVVLDGSLDPHTIIPESEIERNYSSAQTLGDLVKNIKKLR